MPNPKLSDRYKGKSFGEIATEIESKYKDRHDPISRRGLMAEMQSLRSEQEYQKQKQQITEQLNQTIQQFQQGPQPTQEQVAGQPPMIDSNQGIQLPPIEQDQGQFQHAASQPYNQKFGYGGTMDYFNGGSFNDPLVKDVIDTKNYNDLSSFMNYSNDDILARFKKDSLNNNYQNKFPNSAPTSMFGAAAQQMTNVASQRMIPQVGGIGAMGFNFANIASQLNNSNSQNNQSQNNNLQRSNLNAMRYAPLLSNLFNIFSARRPDSTQGELSKMGFRDKVDESLAGNVIPRQTQFQNIDMSQIERGIQNQARNFTGSNINVSGGNAGQFLSNELANQSNIMNAIGQARMQAQMQDRQIDGMNAQEQARIDQFNQSQQMQRADLQRFNIGMGLQMADLDARNEGAFLSNRAANIMGLGTNIGNIGREEDMMKMIANTMGYDSFGQYVANLRPEDRKKVETSVRKQLFGGIFKSRKKSN